MVDSKHSTMSDIDHNTPGSPLFKIGLVIVSILLDISIWQEISHGATMIISGLLLLVCSHFVKKWWLEKPAAAKSIDPEDDGK